MKITKLLWSTFWMAVAAFPVLGIVQLLSNEAITPYDDYVEFIVPVYSFLKGNLDWIIIAFLTYIAVARKLEVKYLIQEKIRKRQYYLEYERWSNTPYIPPLLFFYMMSPPTSFSPFVSDRAINDFYPLLVRDFQNRVSINANITSDEPGKRVSVLKVVGYKIISNWILHLAVLGSIFYFFVPQLNFIEVFTQTNAKFLIPVISHIVAYNMMVAMAIGQTAPWKLLDNKLLLYFKDDYLHHEPRIPWVDVLPDTDKGYGIEKMWERDCFNRIQSTYKLKGWSFPHNKEEIKWINPSIPSNPFPDNLDMSWAPQAREHVQAVKERWQDEIEHQTFEAINNTRDQKEAQVVAFKKKKS